MLEIVGERLHDFIRSLQLLHEEALRTTDALESAIETWGDEWGIRQRIIQRHNLLEQWFRGENLETGLVDIISTHTMDERCFCYMMDVFIPACQMLEFSGLADLYSRTVTTLRRICEERFQLLSQMLRDVMRRELNRRRM